MEKKAETIQLRNFKHIRRKYTMIHFFKVLRRPWSIYLEEKVKTQMLSVFHLVFDSQLLFTALENLQLLLSLKAPCTSIGWI
jgi:hypothetical protein